MKRLTITAIVFSIIAFIASIINLLLNGDDHIKVVYPHFILFAICLLIMIYFIVFYIWIMDKDTNDIQLKERTGRLNSRINEQEMIIAQLKDELEQLKNEINYK